VSIAAPLKTLKILTQSYVHDSETQTYVYKSGKVQWEGGTLEGTEITYFRDNNTIVATGFVRLIEGSVTAIMDRMEFSPEDATGILYNVILFDSEHNAYMTANIVRKEGVGYFVGEGCTFTTCDSKDPSWEVRGRKIQYYSQNFSSSQSTFLYVKGVPVFYFPYLAWPTVTRRQSGVLPPEYSIVRSSINKFDLGYRLAIPYFWAIDQEQDLTSTVEWVERRGPGVRLDYQYAFKAGMRGSLFYQRYFERDPRDPQNEAGALSAEDAASSDLKPPRFKAAFNHNQSLESQTRLISSGVAYSDSQFQREYYLIREPEPNYAQYANFSLSRQYSQGSVSLSATQARVFSEIALLNRNTDHKSRVQTLPALSFSYNTTLASRLTWNSGGSLVRYYREEGYNGVGTHLNPSLSYRFRLWKHFNVNTNYGKSLSAYHVWDSAIPGSSDDYSFEVASGSIGISTTLSRVWEQEQGVYSKFKHLLTPSLSYSFVEDVDQTAVSGTTPFGGGISTQRLMTFQLSNVLMVKRRYLERSVHIGNLAISKMRRNGMSEAILSRLETITGKEFESETVFLEQLQLLFANTLTDAEQEEILKHMEQGVSYNSRNLTNRPTREGKSWVMGTLNLIQPFDYLKADSNFKAIGPESKGNETEQGEGLLPLKLELSVLPSSNFSVNFFNRYHHQQQKVVEYSLEVKVGVSTYNKASVSFRENEIAYITPSGKSVSAASSFSFSDTFEASDRVSFGFSGTANLAGSSLRRRLVSDSVFLNYRPDCWKISVSLSESAGTTTTSGGVQKEYVDRTIYTSIVLGEFSLPQQILPNVGQ